MSADQLGTISRDPEGAASDKFDVIILGGGIYGTMLLMEASLRGLRALLLEKADFGGATSFNSLRIVHGGLRYLQSADLPRFFESVSERRWYLRAFPDLVKPLPCIMPLYGQGLHRPSVLKMALASNDLLSMNRNRAVREDRILPNGRTLTPAETAIHFPRVRKQGLKGAALWYDAAVPDSHRLIIEILRFACASGGTAVNYVEGAELLTCAGRVKGITALDHHSGNELQFSAPIVVNATGPWVRKIAARFDHDEPSLFNTSLAWNALFNREALSGHAVAVSAPGRKSHTYFLNPWKGRLLVGTVHSPFSGSIACPAPNTSQIAQFVADINKAMPDLHIQASEICHLFCGLLPAANSSGEGLAMRPVLLDHGERGGPNGLFSISGVKLTTARRVANMVFDCITGKSIQTGPMAASALGNQVNARLENAESWDLATPVRDKTLGIKEVQERLARVSTHESVVYREDLFMRRTTLWELGAQASDFVCNECPPNHDRDRDNPKLSRACWDSSSRIDAASDEIALNCTDSG